MKIVFAIVTILTIILSSVAAKVAYDWAEGNKKSPDWTLSKGIIDAGVQDCDAYFDCCSHISTVAPEIAAKRCHDLFTTIQSQLDRVESANRGRGAVFYGIESTWAGVLFRGVSGRVRITDPCQCKPEPPRANLNTPFEVASISKIITTAAVLLLAEDRKLSLMDSIDVHLPPNITTHLLIVNNTDVTKELKIWHLLSHRGGLPDFWSNSNFIRAFSVDFKRFWEATDTLLYARQLQGHFVPQSSIDGRFYYADTGFVLAGMVAEAVYKGPLHRLFREWIFEPLGMNTTYMSYREKRKKQAPEAHRYEGWKDLYGRRRQSADWASGGIISDLRDLGLFTRLFMEGYIVKPKTLNLIRRVGTTHGFFGGSRFIAYSLGTMRLYLKNFGNFWGHDGHGNVFAFYWEEIGISIVGSFNQLHNDWLSQSVAILKAILKFFNPP